MKELRLLENLGHYIYSGVLITNFYELEDEGSDGIQAKFRTWFCTLPDVIAVFWGKKPLFLPVDVDQMRDDKIL
jgi:hypothetical protein